MSEETPEYPIDLDGFNPNVPPNPDRWWAARRGHAKWAAIFMMVTIIIFSTMAWNVDAKVVSAASPVFITVIITQALIIISYVVSATYIDKVIKPFSKIPGIG